ncbi:MAG TPA: DUF1634 domain-containing protein [Candidatus Acidoferrales bacterium]|nr:DUF1634 domain-containing protein [Candidatus Acidoferrales bacterium]
METNLNRVIISGICTSIVISSFGVVVLALQPETVTDLTLVPAQLFSGIKMGNPLAIMNFGIILLIISPVMWLLTVLVSFVGERDRNYIVLSIFVLLMLISSSVIITHL